MKKFVPVFAASFFLSLHFGALLFINSSLLGKFFGPNVVSFLFLLGALGATLLFLNASKLIGRFGKRRLLIFFLTLTAINTAILALATTPGVVAISFIIYAAFLPIIFYCLDIFLEELSTDARTGGIRGAYLTFINLGIALGPLSLVVWAGEDLLGPVYLAAVLLLIPPILFSLFSFKSRLHAHQVPHYRPLALPFGLWWHNRNVRRATLARLILEFFFALMVIYTPIYLHGQLGFGWSELGLIFTVMLLPFVLFEWLAGRLADRVYGEKEIMSLGFLITGLSLLVMPFIGKNFLAWMVILFLSRVGASLIEIMTESYFFKHVNARDTGLISIFRLTRTVSIILGVMVGALTIGLFPFENMFFILAGIVFFGLTQSLTLKDTL